MTPKPTELFPKGSAVEAPRRVGQYSASLKGFRPSGNDGFRPSGNDGGISAGGKTAVLENAWAACAGVGADSPRRDVRVSSESTGKDGLASAAASPSRKRDSEGVPRSIPPGSAGRPIAGELFPGGFPPAPARVTGGEEARGLADPGLDQLRKEHERKQSLDPNAAFMASMQTMLNETISSQQAAFKSELLAAVGTQLQTSMQPFIEAQANFGMQLSRLESAASCADARVNAVESKLAELQEAQAAANRTLREYIDQKVAASKPDPLQTSDPWGRRPQEVLPAAALSGGARVFEGARGGWSFEPTRMFLRGWSPYAANLADRKFLTEAECEQLVSTIHAGAPPSLWAFIDRISHDALRNFQITFTKKRDAYASDWWDLFKALQVWCKTSGVLVKGCNLFMAMEQSPEQRERNTALRVAESSLRSMSPELEVLIDWKGGGNLYGSKQGVSELVATFSRKKQSIVWERAGCARLSVDFDEVQRVFRSAADV
jgi:hypothetical protein